MLKQIRSSGHHFRSAGCLQAEALIPMRILVTSWNASSVGGAGITHSSNHMVILEALTSMVLRILRVGYSELYHA